MKAKRYLQEEGVAEPVAEGGGEAEGQKEDGEGVVAPRPLCHSLVEAE